MESTDKTNITAFNPDNFIFDADLPDNTGQRCSEKDFERAVGDVIQTLDPHIKSSVTVCIIVDDYTRFTPTAEIISS